MAFTRSSPSRDSDNQIFASIETGYIADDNLWISFKAEQMQIISAPKSPTTVETWRKAACCCCPLAAGEGLEKVCNQNPLTPLQKQNRNHEKDDKCIRVETKQR